MIMNATELLRLHAEDHPYLSRYAEMIASATERGAEITRQILLFARPDSAQLRPLSLSQLAAEVCQLLRHSFPKNITIETVWEGDNDFILADWSHLHQVLLNLALNARDAMPDGGTLTIRVDRERGENLRTRFPESGPEEYVAVHVSDTGVGMDEATRAHIFDPFFSTKERGKGTGLGLAIVYGIVQNHRGFIDVQSTPGQGTTVTLYFPATSPPARSVPPPEEAEQGRSGGTETILVVEDEEAIRETLQEILSSAGYTVLTAANGMEALDQYQRHQQDIALVITDLHMPSMGGKELMKRLQEIQPTLKVMFATGSLDHCSPSAVLEDGANAVITKPFRIQELLTTIRKTLEDRPVSYLEGEEA
ncbi:MAG: response regulator [Nitrospinota bacterium]|nr:MAG: response regulator [Nitrospinota bacterium]